MINYSLLILEDDPSHVAAILRAFDSAKNPPDIRVASTLQEYCSMAEAFPPDIALLDLNLPDGDQQASLCLLSEDGPFPMVVMTSMGNEEVAVAAMKLGAADYLVKSPETFANMPSFIHKALHLRKLGTNSAAKLIREAITAYKELSSQTKTPPVP